MGVIKETKFGTWQR